MQFLVYPLRHEGRLKPKHVMWAGEVRGDLFVTEVRDPELNRTVRQARIVDADRELLPPLLDVVLVAAKPDWWSMTGWERGLDAVGAKSERAYQQSWVLIPVDKAGRPDRPTSAAAPSGVAQALV